MIKVHGKHETQGGTLASENGSLDEGAHHVVHDCHLRVQWLHRIRGCDHRLGFHPDKTTPSIQNSFDNSTNTTSIYIPVYVNNTGMIGFPIEDLRVDFNIFNATTQLANETNVIGNIPHGSAQEFNVTMIKADSFWLFTALNGSTGIRMEILFTIRYVVTSVQLNVSIDLPGGLSF